MTRNQKRDAGETTVYLINKSMNDSGGEFSVWEFGGYEPYHMAYDHFVGNADCVHIIVFRASDPQEVSL